MEIVQKQLLNVVDNGVFATSDRFHAQLLAQSPEKTDKRNAVIDKKLYDELDQLRRFGTASA